LCCVFCFVYRRAVYCVQCLQKTKIHNTNIENRRDNQEWAAVNIGHNTLKEDKQKYTTQT
jgi:hypothetical protein